MNFKSVFAKGFTAAVITGFLALGVHAQEPARKDTSRMHHKMEKMHKMNKKMDKMDKKMDKKVDKMKKDTARRM